MEHSPLAEAVLEVPGLEVGQLYSKELLELRRTFRTFGTASELLNKS